MNYLTLVGLVFGGSILAGSITSIIAALELNPPKLIKRLFKNSSQSTKVIVRVVPMFVLLGLFAGIIYYLSSFSPSP